MGVKRKACKSCPFRKDANLWPGDEGIQFLRTVLSRDRFPCHLNLGKQGQNLCFGSHQRWKGRLEQYPELVGSVDEFIEKHLPAFKEYEGQGWDDLLGDLLREAARDLNRKR